MAVVRIKVPHQSNRHGVYTPKCHEYNLGLGPCGKNVMSMAIRFERDFFVIEQRHDDGTGKDFFYRTVDITGRITVEHG